MYLLDTKEAIPNWGPRGQKFKGGGDTWVGLLFNVNPLIKGTTYPLLARNFLLAISYSRESHDSTTEANSPSLSPSVSLKRWRSSQRTTNQKNSTNISAHGIWEISTNGCLRRNYWSRRASGETCVIFRSLYFKNSSMDGWLSKMCWVVRTLKNT
jgi:hypothetical protein